MKTYNICIASDHVGFKLKASLIKHLKNANLSVLDLGTNSEETVDYPDYAAKLVDSILEKTTEIGILICATGIGMSIAANRNSKIRAALCTNQFMAERARMHNDSNILVLGAEVTDTKLSINILDKFLSGKFEGGRHSTRISKIG